MCTAQDVVQCVHSRHFLCFCAWGAARSHDQKVKRLPTPRGGPAQRPHQTHLPTSWAPVQRESRALRLYPSRIPGGATDSGCVRPRTRVSCLIKRRCTGEWASERVVTRRALLNAGTPCESTSERVTRPPNGWSEAGPPSGSRLVHPTGNRLGCSASKWFD